MINVIILPNEEAYMKLPTEDLRKASLVAYKDVNTGYCIQKNRVDGRFGSGFVRKEILEYIEMMMY